jgi:endoglucanase Acf2
MGAHAYESIPSDDSEVAKSTESSQAISSSKFSFTIAVIGFLSSLIIFWYIFTTPFIGWRSSILRTSLVRSLPFKQISHPEPPSSLWGSVVKPYPTGAFWTNFVIRNGDYPVGVLPYGVKCLDSGIQVSYGAWRRFVSQVFIQDVFGADLQISSYQPYVSRGIETYDNFSVTMAYKTATGGKYKAHLVKGSPFITVVYENATPVVSTTIAKIINAEFRLSKANPGVQYVVTLSNNQKWLVYCSETVPLILKDNTLTTPYPIRGFIRVAFLPMQNSDAAFGSLMNYIQKYPTGATLSITYPGGNAALVTYQYTSVGAGPLLMLSLPHHSLIMVSPADTEESRRVQSTLTPIYCMKGKMKPIVGDVWKLQYNLPQVSHTIYTRLTELILVPRLVGTTF